MKILPLLTLAASAEAANGTAQPPTMRNIGYLGAGYNVFQGNPHSSDLAGGDPGFGKNQIFSLTYNQGLTTSDQRWSIPDGTTVRSVAGCTYSSTASIVKGAQSYSNSLSQDVSVSGSGWGASFSVSTDYQRVEQSSSQYTRSNVENSAKCSVYSAQLTQYVAHTLTLGFRNGVKTLVDTSNKGAYSNFIDAFGTHYTRSVDMGAKAILRSEFDDTAWSGMISSGLNVQAGAQASFIAFSGGASTETSTQRQQREAFESRRRQTYSSFIGTFNKNYDSAAWAISSQTNPYPLKYMLDEISDLLVPTNFPEIGNILQIQSAFHQATQDWCSSHPTCKVPGPDPVDLGFKIVSNTQSGTRTLDCGSGLSSIACGIQLLSSQTSNSTVDAEGGNDAWLTRATIGGCQCSATYDICYATCIASSFTAGQISTKTSHGTGDQTAVCGSGYKVVGCGMDNYGVSDKRATGPSAYPFSITGYQNGCKSYTVTGGTIYAYCMSNVKYHSVATQAGSGTFSVSCPSGTYALGCGLQQSTGIGGATNPAYYPSSESTCTCRTIQRSTCFAACGVIY